MYKKTEAVKGEWEQNKSIPEAKLFNKLLLNMSQHESHFIMFFYQSSDAWTAEGNFARSYLFVKTVEHPLLL